MCGKLEDGNNISKYLVCDGNMFWYDLFSYFLNFDDGRWENNVKVNMFGGFFLKILIF